MKKLVSCMMWLIFGFCGGGVVTLFREDKKIKNLYNICQKDEKIIKLYCFWTRNKQSYGEYLKSLGFERIIVYGVGYLGKSLINELSNSCVDVLYAVDENPNGMISGINVVKPSEMDEKADVIIVTAVNDFCKIKDALNKKINRPIISIEDIIYRLV